MSFGETGELNRLGPVDSPRGRSVARKSCSTLALARISRSGRLPTVVVCPSPILPEHSGGRLGHPRIGGWSSGVLKKSTNAGLRAGVIGGGRHLLRLCQSKSLHERLHKPRGGEPGTLAPEASVRAVGCEVTAGESSASGFGRRSGRASLGPRKARRRRARIAGAATAVSR